MNYFLPRYDLPMSDETAILNLDKEPGHIIILNGTTLSGKSTIAKRLQEKLTQPFFHMELDQFLAMLPPNRNIDIFHKLVEGYHNAVQGMAASGCNVIMDHVLLEEGWVKKLVEQFEPFKVFFIGLECPLQELERRERERHSGKAGFARSQYMKIHRNKTYDLKLDTSALNVAACVNRILELYDNGNGDGLGFDAMHREFEKKKSP